MKPKINSKDFEWEPKSSTHDTVNLATENLAKSNHGSRLSRKFH